jgi:hypothetical protein
MINEEPEEEDGDNEFIGERSYPKKISTASSKAEPRESVAESVLSKSDDGEDKSEVADFHSPIMAEPTPSKRKWTLQQ